MRRPLIVADPPKVFGKVVLDRTAGSDPSGKDPLVDAVVGALSARGLLRAGEEESVRIRLRALSEQEAEILADPPSMVRMHS